MSKLRDFEQSLEYSAYVRSKDPLCVSCLRTQTYALMAAGDYERAEKVCRRPVAVTGGAGTFSQAMIQLLQGDAEPALETIETSQTIPYVMTAGRAMANWSLGRAAEYEVALAELEAFDDEEYKNHRVRPDDYRSRVYARVGFKDEAFEILDRLINPPESWGPSRWHTDPMFASLHDDPRWLALREKEEVGPQQIKELALRKRFPGPGMVPDYEVPQ